MDSKDVEEIFKGVLTDESHTASESVLPETPNNSASSSTYSINHSSLSTNPVVVNNPPQSVIISQGPPQPPIMSPSHSGKNIVC